MTPAAYAVVDFDAVRYNLGRVRDYAPHARIMAVIKANGYGHGLERIAEALADVDVDAFAVARVDEGIRLRRAGFKNRIAVLEGFTYHEELDEFLSHDLEAIVHSFNQLELFESRAERGRIAVWLKLDTGMNRLGFKAKDLRAVYHRRNDHSCTLDIGVGKSGGTAHAGDGRQRVGSVCQTRRSLALVGGRQARSKDEPG